MIQVKSLERDASDHDQVVADLQSNVSVVQRDLDWLLQVGLVWVVDKLIEHPEFTGAMSLTRHAAFVPKAESVRKALANAGYQGVVDASPLALLLA